MGEITYVLWGGLVLFKAKMIVAAVFLDGLFEIDIIDVSQGTKPGKDIAKLFYFIVMVVAGQGGGKLPNLLDKPEECGGSTALTVTLTVFFTDNFLKFLDCHNLACPFKHDDKSFNIWIIY